MSGCHGLQTQERNALLCCATTNRYQLPKSSALFSIPTTKNRFTAAVAARSLRDSTAPSASLT